MASRRQLYAIGVTRWQIRARVTADRWQKVGDQSVCLHNAAINPVGLAWAAVFQGGPRACLDGASALIASGLTQLEWPRLRVSVPRGARVRRTPAVDIRQTRRWSVQDLAPTGIPRTRPSVAAVRAALWARSDRQAALVLTMSVQQGLVTPEQLGEQALRIRRDKRRRLVNDVVLDLAGGARALGEAEVVAELERRGLPAPQQQVWRRDGSKRYYLDLYWPQWGLVVEIDGIHHLGASQVVGDALRQNALALEGDIVLRFPLLGLRLTPDDFYGQIENALRRLGWSPAADGMRRVIRSAS